MAKGRAAGRDWTIEERQTLLNAKRRHPRGAWGKVAKLLPGRTAVQCEAQWCNRDRWLDANERVIGTPDAGLRPGAGNVQSGYVKRIPQRVLTDRAERERLKYAPRSVTAEFFNDPLPGCSALDHKLGNECETVGRLSICTGAPLKRDTRPIPTPSLYWGKLKPEQVRA